MKLRKGLIALMISILMLAVSTNTFAVTSKNSVTNNTTNTVKNEVEDDEEVVENKTKNTTNTMKNETKNETSKITKSSTSKSKNVTTSKSSKTEVINADIVNAESDKNLEYKDVVVNGNIFIANSDKIIFDNVKVNGDVVVFAANVEIINSEIEGSAYITATEKLAVTDSEINAMYCLGDKVEISDGTEISRELRAVGSTVTINGEIGRDVYVFAESVKFQDNAKVSGKAVIKSESKTISENADIPNLDYEKVNYSNTSDTSESIITYLIEKGTEIVIILLIAIFILCGFPKFTEVNSSLRLRDFFKAFFTGLLEFIVIVAIAVGLFFTGYGIGYGLILLNLLITFVILGKVLFIVSFAIRLSCKPEKISKIKAFFTIVVVALVIAFIEMVSVAGTTGMIIDMIINCVLAITGFGSMFRVIFTSKKKLAMLSQIKTEGKQENVVEVVTEPEKSSETTVVEGAGQDELLNTIKAEVKEEIEELQKEREEEKKLEENTSAETSEKVEEEVKKEVKQENKEEIKEESKEKDSKENDKKNEEKK